MGELSKCCGAPKWLSLDSDICDSCREHADFYDEDDEDEGGKVGDSETKEPETWYDRFDA